MRSMFIVATLIFALFTGEYALAQTKEPIPECGTTYTCFVPSTCLEDATPFSASTQIEEIKGSRPVTKDCAAIIRFHVYTPLLMYVWIESLDAVNTPKSIEFKHKSIYDDESSFKCEVDQNNNNEVKGFYKDLSGVIHGKIIEAQETPLKCVFLVKTQAKANDFIGTLKYIIDSAESAWSSSSFIILHCDPSLFKFKPSDKPNPDEKYQELSYNLAKPGKYACEGNLFNRMEFRDDVSEQFSTATDLKCVGRKFYITLKDKPSSPIEDGFINIRCVADAEYFCKYSVKTLTPNGDASVAALVQAPANPTIPKKGEIKCPSTHPFIMMNQKPIENGVFKCQNRGASLWTVNGIALRENSAEVYCANELKCHVLDKLPASSIKKGTLVNYLPTCPEHGTMKVFSTSNVVTSIYCNKQTGKYMYKTGNQDIEVGKTTFICEYPKTIDTKKNEENKSKALKGGLITTVCSIAGAIVLIAAVLFLISYLRAHFLEQKMMKMDEAAFNDFYLGEAAKKKKDKQQRKQGNKGEQPSEIPEAGENLTNPDLLPMRQVVSNAYFRSGVINVQQLPNELLSKVTTDEKFPAVCDSGDVNQVDTEMEPMSASEDFMEMFNMYKAAGANVMGPSEELSAKDLEEDKKNK